MKRLKIYLAGPLFSLGEREFNKRLVNILRKRIPGLSFMIPQEHAKRIYGQERFTERMFKHCIQSINRSDVMLAILDGPDVDSGTCVEMGYAYACRKPIIGVRTDFRSSEDKGVNVMVSQVCKEMIWLPSSRLTEKELVENISKALKRVFSEE